MSESAAPALPLESPHGEVITFYSYKGGTGRSMALANTACLLAGEGDEFQTSGRVLMVDWDLEAPGLHRYFRDALRGGLGAKAGSIDAELDKRKGLVDLLVTVQNGVYESTPEGEMQDQDAADALLAACSVQDYILHTDNPQLDLLKAGAQNESYGQRVNTFDWEGLFQRSPWLFRALADRLAREYDYVLVDSRTGETDTSSICTRMLPQKLVVVFTPNRQSLTGVDKLVRKAIAYRARSEDPRPLAVFPLPSRVDSTFPTFVQNWRDGNSELDLQGYRWHFETLLQELYQLPECDLGEYFKEVELQYIPEYSFGEEVAVRREKGARSRLSFTKSYETFARWLVERNGPWETTLILRDREKRAEERRAGRASKDPLTRLTSDEQREARRVLTRLVRLSHGRTGVEAQPASAGDLGAADVLESLQAQDLVTIEPPDDRGVREVRIRDEVRLLSSARFSEWIDADRDFLLWRQELADARTRWEARGRPADLLWTGTQVQKANVWRAQRAADLSPVETEFLDRSSERKDAPPTPLPEKKKRARNLLRGVDAELSEIERLAKELKNSQEFGYARRLFARARRHSAYASLDESHRLYLGQQHALCTYKDPDLSAERFTRALEILREIDDPARSLNQETLGLAGAIFKRRWQVEGQRWLLERSLQFYRRGHELGAAGDQGYTGGNAAFILDLLAREEARVAKSAGGDSAVAATRRGDARRIREELIEALPPLLDGSDGDAYRGQWWFYATVAEAFFGLAKYDEAVAWLRRGPPVSTLSRWEFESTIQQFGSLVQLHEDFLELMPDHVSPPPQPDPDKARVALRGFLGEMAPGVERVVAGKVGLALSGGGFRASLFHIGVLACLAERDALRHVEVLSCVSGGSIIGAQYYLEVQRVLSQRPDGEITKQDYIEIVHRLEEQFLRGVETNVRSSVLSEVWTNLKAMFLPTYSRTERLGELYESRLFSRVEDGKGKRPRMMSDLKFIPAGEDADRFKPKYDNWRRRNKVPTLVLNATTLNSGHNWQFTATWMGEPPSAIDSEIDGNYRLRRMYYDEAPDDFKHIRLGQAVAASSCVPGLFEPIVLKGLYPDKIVRLVDGGVYDNQGIASLLEQDCTVMIVSDASGQMSAVDEPSAGMIGVPLRSFSVSMARVRQAEFHELDARRRSSSLRGLMFLHMKKDLDVDPVDWVDCQDPSDASEDARPIDRRGVLTRFGIRKDVQELLAGIRTDLDSFSEIEAYALMTSGYRMAQLEFRSSVDGLFPAADKQSSEWRFLEAEPLLGQGPRLTRVKKHLSVGSQNAFKIWRLSRMLTSFGLVVLVGLVGWLASNWQVVADTWNRVQSTPLLTVGTVGGWLVSLVATLILGPLLIRLISFRQSLGQVGLVTAATLLMCFVFKLHRLVFDRWFLWAGRLSRFRKETTLETS